MWITLCKFKAANLLTDTVFFTRPYGAPNVISYDNPWTTIGAKHNCIQRARDINQ